VVTLGCCHRPNECLGSHHPCHDFHNCFKKAGIVKAEVPDTDPTIREDEDDDEEDLIPRIVTRLRAQGNAIAIEDLERMLDLVEAYTMKVNVLISMVNKEQLKKMRQPTLDSFKTAP